MKNVIGKRLNQILAMNNTSAHRFALEHDMSVSTITDIVSGRAIPRVDTLLKIADGLDMDVCELLTDPSEMSFMGRDDFLQEVYNRSANYDELTKGKVLGYMDRVSEEKEGER